MRPGKFIWFPQGNTGRNRTRTMKIIFWLYIHHLLYYSTLTKITLSNEEWQFYITYALCYFHKTAFPCFYHTLITHSDFPLHVLADDLFSTLQLILLFPDHLHNLVSSYITLSCPSMLTTLSFIFPTDFIKAYLMFFSKLLVKIANKSRHDLSTFSFITDLFQLSLPSPRQYQLIPSIL